jgi:tryptophan-rich sensory protein
MRMYAQYGSYKKPGWAPPAWLFGPVWALLRSVTIHH